MKSQGISFQTKSGHPDMTSTDIVTKFNICELHVLQGGLCFTNMSFFELRIVTSQNFKSASILDL